MNPLDAVDVLATYLRDAGLDVVRDDQGDLSGESGSHAIILDAFCAMARLPADTPLEHNGMTCRVGDDPDNDLLLHESGLSDERDRYLVWLTRQASAGATPAANATSPTIRTPRSPALELVEGVRRATREPLPGRAKRHLIARRRVVSRSPAG
jgi:hypothetical protein